MAYQQTNQPGTSPKKGAKSDAKDQQDHELEGEKPSWDHSRNPTDYANGREQATEADRKGE